MLPRRSHNRESAQNTLEFALIMLVLAVLVAAAVGLFSKVVGDIYSRIDTYRNSRLAAESGSLLSLNQKAENYLYFNYDYVDKNKYGPSGAGFFSGQFSQEQRINKAQLFLNQQYYILSLILPYQNSQAKFLTGLLKIKDKNCGTLSGYPCKCEFIPKGLVPVIRAILRNASGLFNTAPGCYGQAERLYEDVYKNPSAPGPYDTKVDPAKYGLNPNNPEDAKLITSLKTQHTTLHDDLGTEIKEMKDNISNYSSNNMMQLIVGSWYMTSLNVGNVIQTQEGCSPDGSHQAAVDQIDALANQNSADLPNPYGNQYIANCILEKKIADKAADIASKLNIANTGRFQLGDISKISQDDVNQSKDNSDILNSLAQSSRNCNSDFKNAAKSLNRSLTAVKKYLEKTEKEKDKNKYKDIIINYLAQAQLDAWAVYEVAGASRLLEAAGYKKYL